MVGLIGPNGGGESKLLDIVAGEKQIAARSKCRAAIR